MTNAADIVRSYEDHMKILHWLPEEDRWEVISWSAWADFRELLTPFVALPGIVGGIHYFIVLVHDDDMPINLIPHKYLIEPDGRIGWDNFAGLTRQEREDYNRLMIAREESPGDRERLSEIRGKMGRVYWPPQESIDALIRALGKKPRSDSAAAAFLEELRSVTTESN